MQNKLQEKPDGTGVHSSLWKLALYMDLGEERLSTFYILNGSSLLSINGSYFQGKWRHDDLCNAQPCQSCTTGSTATPRRRNCLFSEKSSTSSKNPDWRPIKCIYLQDNDSPPTPKSFWPWVKGVLAAPPGQKVLLVMSALPGEGERGHGTRTRPTRTVASGNPEAIEKAETWRRASP